MTTDTPAQVIRKLGALLDEERESLLTGDLQTSAGLLETKEALVDSLNALPPLERAQLENLHTKMARNQILLDGALEGIRKVSARISAIRKTRTVLETYDNNGNKSTITTDKTRRVEKRA